MAVGVDDLPKKIGGHRVVGFTDMANVGLESQNITVFHGLLRVQFCPVVGVMGYTDNGFLRRVYKALQFQARKLRIQPFKFQLQSLDLGGEHFQIFLTDGAAIPNVLETFGHGFRSFEFRLDFLVFCFQSGNPRLGIPALRLLAQARSRKRHGQNRNRQ